MTSKEALERLHDLALPSTSPETFEHRNMYCKRMYDIIKKDLNRVKEAETNYHCALATLEAQKEEIQELREKLNVEEEFCVLLQKKLAKLEEVNDILKYCFTETWGLDGYYQAGLLTKEDYELLKEVLYE